MLPEAPADRHAAIAATFAARVRGVRDWSAAAPVEGWTALDVVRHLTEWFPVFLRDAGVPFAELTGVEHDPVRAWDEQTQAVQQLFGSGVAFNHPRVGEMDIDQAIAMFYTADVFMHTWDLSRATGQDETLDEDLCAEMLAGMTPIEEMLRGSGQFGPKVPVPDSATVQERFLGFIGRDPRPPI